MKVTVCQLEPREESLTATMTALAKHVRVTEPDFVLLPELPFFEWLAAEPQTDSKRWARAVEAHAERIAALGDLGAGAVAGEADRS